MAHPIIIQGGMGIGVSHWPLARAVSSHGQLGVVSGTALDVLLVRRLQDGDPGGHVRRALAQFPIPGVADRILAAFFLPEGRPPGQPYRTITMTSVRPPREAVERIIAANFVEVFLAREGHSGVVGINFLHKVQLPTLPSIYGALLAGVDYILMGAGVPMAIPGAIDRLARGESAELALEMEGAVPDESHTLTFDPVEYTGNPPPILKRPAFLAIVSSATLAIALARKANGRVDGFVVEGASAGGHNAPPRGQLTLNDRGEPVFGPRDVPDLEKIRALGLPFWVAGSTATPEALASARAAGATGIQVGTGFAFCEESGIRPDLKARVLAASQAGTLDVFTDPLASPTGFPFKVARLAGTASEPEVCAARERVCDLGYLRTPYRKAEGSIGYRCPGEPEAHYLVKGGCAEDTCGRKCICNGLFATVGFAQLRSDGTLEPALVTAGVDAQQVARFLRPGASRYTAADVLDQLLA
jgi:nitronate monooxygenase